MRASQLFTEDERKRVAAAIAAAEGKTSAEIVAVVATASGRYDRAEDIFGFLAALLALVAGWLFCPAFHADPAWGGGPTTEGLVPALVTLVVAFAAGSALATRFTGSRLPFVMKTEIEEEVRRAAQSAFMSSRIRDTDGGTGVLLYVSLFEHRVVVLPDDAVTKALPNQDWREVCDLIVSGMKSGKPADAMEQAIARCGEILGPALPRQADDVDELSNELILVD